MPLRDHFHPPFSTRYSWDMVHGQLPGEITRYLNTVLPDEYAAGPLIRSGHGADLPFDPEPLDPEPDAVIGGWHPESPRFISEAEWARLGRFEIEIRNRSLGDELVAAVELVAPSNKDRTTHRWLFVSKCAGLLQAGVPIVIVDIVTNHDANLCSELLDLIGHPNRDISASPRNVYAAALRARDARQGKVLEVWYHPLTIGQPLPTLPLWLNERLALPLDLEPIYEETLRALRIK